MTAPGDDSSDGARRRVFRQLIESLTYEGAISPEAGAGRDGVAEYRLAGRQGNGEPVSYHWLAERRLSFGRVRLRGDVVTRTAGGHSAEADSVRRFLTEVAARLPGDPDRRQQFADELESTIRNDTQARYHWRRRGRRAVEAGDDELEGLIVDGHPYHPSYKSRLGFDAADNAAFGPEFAALIRPRWAAVHHLLTRSAAAPGVDLEAFLAGEIGPPALRRFRAALAHAGHPPDDFRLIPVHPWQWREQIRTRLSAPLAEGTLVPLGMADDDYRAQQSIRTLANTTSPERASLKLSLGIVNTSTGRNLAPHTVVNAPVVTGWLRRLAAADPYLAGELRPVLLGEVAGVTYDPGPAEPAGVPAGLLSAIWRESLRPRLQPGESAAPFTALTHLDAGDEPFVADWVKDQGAEPWAARLLAVAIPPVLRFLLGHGVALEAHAQNLILIHRSGVPARLGLRDFHDGLRFCPALLADPAGAPPLEATPAAHFRVNRNSYLEAATADEVRDFAVDCLFFVNLAELAMFLDDRFGLPERRFWSRARSVVAGYLRRFPPPGGRPVFDVLAPTVGVEQLTTRRLLPDTSVRMHQVPNPLAAVGDA